MGLCLDLRSLVLAAGAFTGWVISPAPHCSETVSLCSQAGFKLLLLLPQPPECCNGRFGPPHLDLQELLVATGWMQRRGEVATCSPGICCLLTGQALWIGAKYKAQRWQKGLEELNLLLQRNLSLSLIPQQPQTSLGSPGSSLPHLVVPSQNKIAVCRFRKYQNTAVTLLKSWARQWWHTSLMLELGRQRQVDLCEFEASLSRGSSRQAGLHGETLPQQNKTKNKAMQKSWTRAREMY